jgi:hypothetical protein
MTIYVRPDAGQPWVETTPAIAGRYLLAMLDMPLGMEGCAVMVVKPE